MGTKPVRIDVDEWLYKGCFIQKFEHPKLVGKYEVFKNNEIKLMLIDVIHLPKRRDCVLKMNVMRIF